MSANHLDPARSIISKIGTEKVAEITGRHVSRVYRWMAPKEKGGTDGFIPPAEARALLDYARKHGVDLSADEFFGIPEAAE